MKICIFFTNETASKSRLWSVTIQSVMVQALFCHQSTRLSRNGSGTSLIKIKLFYFFFRKINRKKIIHTRTTFNKSNCEKSNDIWYGIKRWKFAFFLKVCFRIRIFPQISRIYWIGKIYSWRSFKSRKCINKWFYSNSSSGMHVRHERKTFLYKK